MAHFRVITVLFVVFCSVLAAPGAKNSEDFEFVEERASSAPSSGSSSGTRTWLLDPANALCGLLRCENRELCLLQDRFTAVCVDKAEVARSGDKVVPLDNSPTALSSKRTYAFDTDTFDESDDDDDVDDNDIYYDEDEEYSDDDTDDKDEYDDYDKDYENDDDEEGNTNTSENVTATTPAAASPQLDRQPFASKQCGGCPFSLPQFQCGTDNRTYSSMCRLHFHNCIHQAKVEVACKGFCPCRDAGRRSSRRNKTSLMSKLRATQQRKQQQLLQADNKRAIAHRPSKNATKKQHNKRVLKKKNRLAKQQRNEVLITPSNNVWGPNECSQDALAAMGNRMLDWFSVIMSDTRHKPQTPSRAPVWCKGEVAWMLGHLDTDASGQLEGRELYQLEHDDRERCIKPFFDRCDLDRDGHISGREWCKCFDKSERPCAALRTASQGLLGGYIPECDSEGWYRPVQCQGSGSLCWCVDRHGVELAYSRTHGRPVCDLSSQTKSMPSKRLSHHTDDDGGDDDIEDTLIEGSADMPLDI